MSKIMLTAADGHSFSAYRAGPQDAAMGLVVVQEIFGVNGHMRFASDAFAARGFAVVSPALFDRAERDVELGYTPEDVQTGIALRAKISDAQVMADIEVAAASLGAMPIGIIGYCWGGTIAWWGATRSTRFKAAVGWYGGGIAATRAETPDCPVQLHFGAEDHGIPLADVDAIRAAQPGVEVFTYEGAGHGFGCEERASFDPRSFELAQSRSLEFFGKHLTA
jgi:carboxymethylenebutenolidase